MEVKRATAIVSHLKHAPHFLHDSCMQCSEIEIILLKDKERKVYVGRGNVSGGKGGGGSSETPALLRYKDSDPNHAKEPTGLDIFRSDWSCRLMLEAIRHSHALGDLTQASLSINGFSNGFSGDGSCSRCHYTLLPAGTCSGGACPGQSCPPERGRPGLRCCCGTRYRWRWTLLRSCAAA